MKKLILTVFTLALLMLNFSFAQLLLNEDFNYNTGDTISNRGWTVFSGTTTNIIKVVNPGLSFTGYSASNVGNAAFMNNTGQDAYLDATVSVSNGSIYASFMINDSIAQSTGDYFLAMLPQTSTSLYSARTFIKLLSTGYYKMGISKGSETAVYTTDSFALKTTYLCVVKYQFNTGTLNDTLKLFMFSSGFPATEPATASAITGGGVTADATDLGRIALRQGTASSAPTLTIDGIHMATTWANLNTTTLNPYPITGVSVTGITTTTSTVNWTKPAGYNNSTMTTLVFLRTGFGFTPGTPTSSVSAYTANSNFSLATSGFQNDSAAKCVFKGDTNTFTITGISPTTACYLLIYVVRDADSVYSAANLNYKWTTANAGPTAVNSISFTATGATTANINWIKDTSYKNTLHTTIVYLKQASAVSAGSSPTTNPIRVTDNTIFGLGTKYTNDTNAFAIYKGDTNLVSVSGLTSGTTYYVMAYTISDADSLYSVSAAGSGTTIFPAPLPVSNDTLIGTSTTAATTSWTKPVGYVNSAYTTLVFVKQGSAITTGTPTKTVSYYVPSVLVGSGTKYQNDTAARCVYKGDTNFVNTIFMNNSAPYYVLIYVVRDADSNYSAASIGTGSCLPPPPTPYYNIAQINHTNATTGNPDSLNVRATLRGIVYGIDHPTGGSSHLFLLRDASGGIAVNSTITFGYLATQGDSIMVQGVVSSVRGLASITISNDTLKKLGSAKPIKNAVPVSTLNEASENDLIVLDTARLLTLGDTSWISNKTYSFVTKTKDTVNMVIYTSSSIAGSHIASTNKFVITGTGSQTSTSTFAPFAFNGYSIIPRKITDIVSIDTNSVHIGVSEVHSLSKITVYPNPFTDKFTVNVSCTKNVKAEIELFDLAGKVLYSTTENLVEGINKIPFITSEIKEGMYFIKISSEGNTYIQKLIK